MKNLSFSISCGFPHEKRKLGSAVFCEPAYEKRNCFQRLPVEHENSSFFLTNLFIHLSHQHYNQGNQNDYYEDSAHSLRHNLKSD